MEVKDLALPGLKLIRPKVFADDRGFFLEPWSAARLAAAGVDAAFVQDNHSRSQKAKGSVPGQAKLIRCARGAIVDVVVDVRPASPTFRQWLAVPLDDVAHEQLFVPVGFGHGFCVVSDVADVCYKVTSYYDPTTEVGFRFDDPTVGIRWPVAPAVATVSPRDRDAPTLDELLPTL